uniref:Uncharacterized protein n=1 Tax=Rhizophora mucronata TaxID=61149 RepID=A0A2P2N4P4_RHIMU
MFNYHIYVQFHTCLSLKCSLHHVPLFLFGSLEIVQWKPSKEC